MNIKYLIFLPLSFFFMNCKKEWLDAKSDIKSVVPSTLTDYQYLIDNTSVMNMYTPAFTEIASDDHYVLDATYNSVSDLERNAYSWSKDYSNRESIDWVNPYNRILYSNVVLEGLNGIEPVPANTYNYVKGQALFNRAIWHYMLSQEFCKPYDSLTAVKDLAPPLRLEADINVPSSNSTVDEFYKQIIRDLNLAKELLPSLPEFKTRPGKQAVFALLSKIYLSMGRYVQAKENSDSCLSYSSKLQNYSDISLTSTTANLIKRYNDEVIYHLSMASFTTTGSGLFIDQNFYKLYDNNDLRKTLYFKVNSNGTYNFRGNYTGASLLFSGLATDDILLIRAECNARLGSVQLAMNDLNNLLVNRWKKGTFSSVAATDWQDALDKILLERRKELVCRGQRWTDLRRLNKDKRYELTLSRIINSKPYTLEPNSYRYTLPIPDDIIQISGINQNIGWK